MLFRMAQHNNTLIGLTTNGFSILNECYSKNEVRKIGKILQDYFDQSAEPTFGKRKLLKDIPITLRIHLDATTIENGALKVIPGAHTTQFTVEEKEKITSTQEPTIIEVGEGGIQIMKPLLLHSSAKSQNHKPLYLRN